MIEPARRKIHLDTDLGGDMDDLCALAMLLRWPGVDLTGITTVTEENGRRAGYVRYILDLEGRSDIPLAAGADVAAGYYRYRPGYPPDEDNWPEPVAPFPGPTDAALDLLKQSIDQGATIVAIGQFTNLALLDQQHPGILRQTDLYLMGGWIRGPQPGYPQWGNDYDYNIQLDIQSAQYVLEHSQPTLIPLEITVQTALRRAYLPGLERAGRLGQLIVRQAEVCAREFQNETNYGQLCSGLPDDLMNFQHDPLACAIALGWREGLTIERIPLRLEIREGWLTETPHPNGQPIDVVTAVDGDRFNEFWFEMVTGSTT